MASRYPTKILTVAKPSEADRQRCTFIVTVSQLTEGQRSVLKSGRTEVYVQPDDEDIMVPGISEDERAPSTPMWGRLWRRSKAVFTVGKKRYDYVFTLPPYCSRLHDDPREQKCLDGAEITQLFIPGSVVFSSSQRVAAVTATDISGASIALAAPAATLNSTCSLSAAAATAAAAAIVPRISRKHSQHLRVSPPASPLLRSSSTTAAGEQQPLDADGLKEEKEYVFAGLAAAAAACGLSVIPSSVDFLHLSELLIVQTIVTEVSRHREETRAGRLASCCWSGSSSAAAAATTPQQQQQLLLLSLYVPAHLLTRVRVRAHWGGGGGGAGPLIRNLRVLQLRRRGAHDHISPPGVTLVSTNMNTTDAASSSLAATAQHDAAAAAGLSGFQSNGCDGAIDAAVAAAAAAAAAAAQMSATIADGQRANHAFPTLFFVDFTFLKAGNLTEVVEMAWLAFNVESSQSLEETSFLVRPEQLLAPADLLAKLDATHEKLAAAVPLGEAVQKLDLSIFQKCQETGKPALLCLFGAEKLRDFRACAAARNVALFTHYSHFANLKQILAQFMHLNGEALTSVGTAAAALQLAAPEGREEGLAACRCMCGLLSLLLSKGLLLLKEHALSVQDESSTNNNTSASPASIPISNGADGSRSAGATGGVAPGVGTHLRLRGLPWDVNDEAVIRFLKPVVNVEPPDVCVCVGLDKRVTGEAFVNLPTTEARDLAVRTLHGRMMGQRWIEVFRASAEDFERAMQRRVAVMSSETRDGRDADVKSLNLTVLKLRGLPWCCTEREVVVFFQEHGFDVSPDSVVMGVAMDGRTNGIAYVELPDSATADAAKERLHRKYLGRRFVEVYPSTREEMFRAKRPGRIMAGDMGVGAGAMRVPRGSRMMGGGAGPYSASYGGGPQGYGAMSGGMGAPQGYGALGGMGCPSPQTGYGGYGAPSHDIYAAAGFGGAPPQTAYSGATAQVAQGAPLQDVGPPSANWNSSVLRLRGMPFNANEQHIVQFFQGFHMTAILPSTIPIDGRPSGEAYVQFVDANEAWRAMQTRNGARMDRRYIELFPASKQEMSFAAQGGDPRGKWRQLPLPH
ncbi:hypothetical protein Esti_002922 [Eimeria stiedai]